MLYGWKEREFDAYKLSRCMCLSNYYRFWDTARYLWQKSSFYHTPCIRRPRYGGSRRNIGTPFGIEKLEWCRYPMVKKIRRYLYSFWRDLRTWQTDRQTDGHQVTAKTALMHMHRAVKIAVFTYRSPHFCFHWRRPWRNHAKCCMDGKRIPCLQIVSVHVPI